MVSQTPIILSICVEVFYTKKAILLLNVFVILLLIAGCKGKTEAIQSSQTPIGSVKENPSVYPSASTLPNESAPPSASISPTEPAVTTDKVKDYYPFLENVRYEYEGKGNEYAEYNVVNEYNSSNCIQQRVSNPGTTTCQVIKVENGTLTKVFSRSETYYRENFLQKRNQKEILLMEPIKAGTSWKLGDNSTRTITSVSAHVSTPSGNYTAVEVTTKGSKDKTISYFVKNIGLVKTVFVSGKDEITSSLAKIKKNVAFTQTINFYFPDSKSDKLNFVGKDVSFPTNDIAKSVLSAAYKKAAEKLGYVFTTNTRINTLYLNKDGAVYIDLNHAFLDELKTTEINERRILQCIVNTFGQYYNSDKVMLTIENKPYQSTNIQLKKGEYLKTNFKNCVEVKP